MDIYIYDTCTDYLGNLAYKGLQSWHGEGENKQHAIERFAYLK